MSNHTLINNPNLELTAPLINQIPKKLENSQYFIEKEFIILQAQKPEACFSYNLPNIQMALKQFLMMLLFFQKSQFLEPQRVVKLASANNYHQ